VYNDNVNEIHNIIVLTKGVATMSEDIEDKSTVHKEIKPEYKKEPLKELRVSADKPGITGDQRKRDVKKLAGAIAHSLRTSGEINVRCFGNASIGKAAKGLCIARDFINQTDEIRLSYSPAFIESDIGGQTLTGISFCTFTTDEADSVQLDDVKSVLMAKGDPKDVSVEERKSRVRKLAGAISHSVAQNGECIVRCFGNAAIGKAAKALAIARGFTATRGPDLYCWSSFIVSTLDDGTELTGIAFYAYSNE
jgi:stage V sporulation protein SpoVS